MEVDSLYLIKEVAELAGVSVRTLHHYDNIGLLVPETLSPAGYRLYTPVNLERLQQILFFKEIGFTLQQIKEILDDPKFDRKQALLEHKVFLEKKIERFLEMVQTVEKTIKSIEGGTNMENKDMFNGFDLSEIEEHQRKYSEEAKQKYGKEIVEKTEEKTKEDWVNIQHKTDAIYKKILERIDQGPADPMVQQEVGKWRQLITDHYYDCTLEIFRGLGDMYVADERFTAFYNKYDERLATFLRDAMHIYCDNQTE
jgi:MerR family transcriptional regulator, multidrug-efflux activator